MKNRIACSYLFLILLISLFGCSKPPQSPQSITAGAFKFDLPASWQYMGVTAEGAVQFATNKDMRRALIGFIKPLNLGNQTALEWTKDEEKELLKIPGANILRKPGEQIVNGRSWIFLAWESPMNVQGKSVMMQGATFYLNDKSPIFEVHYMGLPQRFELFEKEKENQKKFMTSIQLNKNALSRSPAKNNTTPANAAPSADDNSLARASAHLYLSTGEVVHGSIYKEDANVYYVEELDGFKRTVKKAEVTKIEGKKNIEASPSHENQWKPVLAQMDVSKELEQKTIPAAQKDVVGEWQMVWQLNAGSIPADDPFVAPYCMFYFSDTNGLATMGSTEPFDDIAATTWKVAKQSFQSNYEFRKPGVFLVQNKDTSKYFMIVSLVTEDLTQSVRPGAPKLKRGDLMIFYNGSDLVRYLRRGTITQPSDQKSETAN